MTDVSCAFLFAVEGLWLIYVWHCKNVYGLNRPGKVKKMVLSMAIDWSAHFINNALTRDFLTDTSVLENVSFCSCS